MLTGIIDYRAGNLQSVVNALKAVGRECRMVSAPEHAEDLEALVFPGQGSFGDSVKNLRATGLWEYVLDWVKNDRPYLGICLGYQLLFEESEEEPGVSGLAAIPGKVTRFPNSDLKIPHMGWNAVEPSDPADPLWKGIPPGSHFYFVHSYYPEPAGTGQSGCTTSYGCRFHSGIVSGNVVAVQFHPEKSQQAGLRLLENFFRRAEVGAC